jgi:hypothetical protein
LQTHGGARIAAILWHPRAVIIDCAASDVSLPGSLLGATLSLFGAPRSLFGVAEIPCSSHA